MLIGVLVMFLISFHLISQDGNSLDTTMTKKEIKELKKSIRKHERKNFHDHFLIGFGVTYADLNSSVRFEGPNGIASTKIDMERHLGFDAVRMIYSGSFVYRITPRSGLYALYYQLHRKKEYMLDRDIIFLRDTIHRGVLAGGFFNTNVLSIGYLLSILTEEKSFLGIYFNTYITKIRAGVYSEVLNFEKEVGVYAPMPNIGILARFDLTNWLTVSGGAGVFFINAYGLNGSFHDIHATVVLRPTKWLGLSLGYYIYDVNVGFPVEQFRAYVNYNFSGPNLGLHFKF
jgi:hypothetical protein